MRFRLVHHDLIDSTSERAFAALQAGAARHGDVHVARGQSAGRGRRGRSWYSAQGEGLYMSLVLLPPPPPTSPAALTLAAALGLLDGLRALGLRDAILKWPNDLTVGGAKLAGCLVESRGLDPLQPHYVLGIGANVTQRGFPAGLTAERAVTSLALCGLAATVGDVLAAILDALPARLAQARDDDQRLTEDFQTASGLRGASVAVEAGAHRHVGTVHELGFERGLVLTGPDGELQSVALEHIASLEIRGE
ncbi:MAG: biotin--[acetyl-CoA-carboxylase] ligase [Planctomycetota bacterium]|nr:biotin--[acetyl-CoA-carboxylase] ligase [Planctomycetota bacterium]MDP6763018.1 biotin--[acetyl-CoA-carboxylase] ligase [Planctomycetota bacterium]